MPLPLYILLAASLLVAWNLNLNYADPFVRQGKKKSDSAKNGGGSANASGGIGAATSAGGPGIAGDARDGMGDGVNQSSGGCKCVIM